MSKINPYDLPTEEERRVRVVLTNIEWDIPTFRGYGESQKRKMPSKMSVPVDSNLPEEQMIAEAMDAASSIWGFCIADCDVEPIDYGSPKAPDTEEAESHSETLDYVGEIF